MKQQIISRWVDEALDDTDVSSFVTDSTLRYLAVANPRVIGDESVFIGKRPREVFSHLVGGPELCDAYDRVIEHGSVQKTEIEIDDIWFNITLKPTTLPDGQIGVMGVATDTTALKVALREQAHRTKNAFTMAMAIATRTSRDHVVPVAFMNALCERLAALSRSQDEIYHGGGSVSLAALIRAQLGFAIDEYPTRFIYEDYGHVFAPEVAPYVTLALYELYTNSIKHGALSNDNGKIRISCEERNDTVILSWQESGGPEVKEVSHVGFGRHLVETIIPRAVSGRVEFLTRPEGVSWTLVAPRHSQ